MGDTNNPYGSLPPEDANEHSEDAEANSSKGEEGKKSVWSDGFEQQAQRPWQTSENQQSSSDDSGQANTYQQPQNYANNGAQQPDSQQYGAQQYGTGQPGASQPGASQPGAQQPSGQFNGAYGGNTNAGNAYGAAPQGSFQQSSFQQGTYQQGAYQNNGNPGPQGPNAPMTHPYAIPAGRSGAPLSALAVSGLVVGIVSLVLCWLLSLLNVLVFVGLGLSIAGIVATGPTKGKRGRGMAIAGTVVSAVALVLSIVFGTLYVGAFSTGFSEALKSHSTDGSYSYSYSFGSDSGKTVNSDAKIVGFDSGQTAVLNIGDTYLGTTDDGENVVAVVYKIKNTGNAKISFLDVVMDVAKQNGKELEVNYSADDIADGSIADKVQDYDDIAPGQEVEVVRAYTLTDTTKTVSLTATGWGSHDSETLAADVTLK
ncbi:DUF5067 domain-containing protein [Bifidobacterium crudilactis]|jgi:hypothetical protein|uniref:DUF5067 domain-containing protein n=3 Tax=Bifidobacterium crudilactis TaxID=327277 RepID=UPI00055200EA|nr:DUF5067 domain-containing protein [Bifidobacterium crudilactis]